MPHFSQKRMDAVKAPKVIHPVDNNYVIVILQNENVT